MMYKFSGNELLSQPGLPVAPADTGRLALVAASDTGLLRITPGLDLLVSL